VGLEPGEVQAEDSGEPALGVGDVGADAAGCVALALETLDEVHLVGDERACPSAESGAM